MGVICHLVWEACDTTRVTASGTEVGEMPLLHRNSQGPKPGRTATEGEHRGAREGSTWGFLPGSSWPSVQTWWLGRREKETQGPGGPLLCSPGQVQEPEPREPVQLLPATPEPEKAGCLGPGDTALPWMEGARCPEDPQRGPVGSPGREVCSLQTPSR